uniref:Putative c-type lectin n=1 Tax=Nyssomyia neivai TaxID=330878 RepID=A0A1L8DQB7_9DIPT
MIVRFAIILVLTYLSFAHADFNPEHKLTGKTILVSKIRKNWFDALDYCKNKGMTLATVRGRRENRELTNALRNSPAATHHWIGGIRHPNENFYRWIHNNNKIETTGYTNWQPGEPNFGRGIELCMEYWNDPKKKIEWKWNDNDCKQEQIFVCEKRD